MTSCKKDRFSTTVSSGLFTRKRVLIQQYVTLANSDIPWKSIYSYLGLVLDLKFTWNKLFEFWRHLDGNIYLTQPLALGECQHITQKMPSNIL